MDDPNADLEMNSLRVAECRRLSFSDVRLERRIKDGAAVIRRCGSAKSVFEPSSVL